MWLCNLEQPEQKPEHANLKTGLNLGQQVSQIQAASLLNSPILDIIGPVLHEWPTFTPPDSVILSPQTFNINRVLVLTYRDFKPPPEPDRNLPSFSFPPAVRGSGGSGGYK